MDATHLEINRREEGLHSMSMNPSDNENGTFYALINDEGQHSLWPTFADVPAGWTVAHGEETRKSCLDYIEEHWTDMRPRGLIKQMERAGKSRTNTRIDSSVTGRALRPA